MGWSGGSSVMSGLIHSCTKAKLTDAQKEVVYADMKSYLEDEDCDTLDECRGEDEIFDRMLDEDIDE